MTSLIVFIVWLTVKISESKKTREESEREYWEKERAANAVRKQSLDDLAYIEFPFAYLPTEESFTSEGQNIPSSLLMLKDLAGKKIVNLNGISNTDLKLKYGTTNITILSEYDTNFITLCREGHLLSEYLFDMGRVDEAQQLSEALVHSGSDVCAQFTLLRKIYETTGKEDKVSNLIHLAENMTSSRKDAIIKTLTQVEEGAMQS
ncbi:MAG: hypothetical protein IK078_11125 [Lachnospiraceae bacterium]|nr:hypothetical protein [Lachnospiraceae bacterium]